MYTYIILIIIITSVVAFTNNSQGMKEIEYTHDDRSKLTRVLILM